MDPQVRPTPDAMPMAVHADGRLPAGVAGLPAARCVFLRADERLCYVGQRGRCVHFIGGGAFKLVRPCADGEDFLIGFRFRGECVGMEALAGGAYRYEAIALGDAWVCSVGTDGLKRPAGDASAFQRTLDAFAGELEHARERCFLLSRPSACERIAIFLHELSRRLSDQDECARVLDLPMSREDIACYLSVTRETVSRTLANLQGRGIIAVSRRRITVLQPAALARMAHAGGDECDALGGHAS
ncbi:MAG TPA: Crp/Fnr family transcriptional regulator [Lysobacter sp.]